MIRWLFRFFLLSLLLASLVFSLSPVSAGEPIILNDKVVHFLSYFALMLALDFSCMSGRYLLVKIILILSYSIAIEFAQSFIPSRDMSAYDVLANALGVMAFIFILPLIKMQKFYQHISVQQDS
ncbi:MAG: hypothetical protein CBC79_01185 [Gammaproteobacteria bacterium TMED119]|nr:MAG: hypothetical protein CBC79_01185 [Gammaproteobacteria bacterium TMED119]RCL44674.1 MAG: hypothetical protein DBW91_05895 [Candidatus Thioglobus sp.]|tara:strand:- start:754 stop:1125 length:372 start_codon:yes stop_codon:yes gene_type:complete